LILRIVIKKLNSMDIKLLSKEEESLWSEYVNSHPNSDVYNSLKWRDCISKSYGYEPRYYIALEHNQVVGVMPLFLIKSVIKGNKLSSCPFAYHARLLSNNDSIQEAMISKAIEEAKNLGVKYLELKLVDKINSEIVQKFKLEETIPYKSTKLTLADYPVLQSGFSWRLRKDLRAFQRRMEAENLKFSFDSNEDDLKSLWNLILEEYTRKFGVPCGPYKTFKVTYDKLKEDYKIFTVKDEKGRIVAGIIFIVFNGQAIDLYSVTHNDYIRLLLSTLVMGQAIKWCCDNGLKSFSFGPSSPSQESLISFKEKWGGATSDVYYYYYSVSGNVSHAIDFGSDLHILRKVYSRLPLSLVKMTLPIIAKHMG